jgi:hypothetical protein
MNTKKVMPIVALVTAATILVLSSVLVNPVLAQSTTGGAGGTGGSTAGGTGGSTAGGTGGSTAGGTGGSTAGGTGGSTSSDYEEFKTCLSDAETSGVVTEEQIRECFNPIYNENGDSSGSSDDSSSGSSDDSSSGSGSSSDENDGSGSDNSEDN